MEWKGPAIGALVAVMLIGAAQAAPPQQLHGKAVTVSWAESRVQRPVGTSAWQNVNNSVDDTYYISTSGGVFRRQHRTSSGVAGSRSQGGSNTFERAPGGARIAGVVASGASFTGTTMTLIGKYASGARQIVVNFDPGFSSCTARVVQGRETGRNQILVSQITGIRIEVQSVQVSGATCSVQAGNPFAGR